MNPRLQTINLLQEVIDRGKPLPKMDNPLIQHLCFGVLRWYFQLASVANALLKKPFRNKDSDLFILLLIGLYQIEHSRTPDHAAVSEAVAACDALKKPWAKSLINAVLRNFIRQKDKIYADLENDLEFKFSHPSWLIEKIQTAWPNDWENILTANNQHPPMTLRCNQLKTSREDYLKRLEDARPGKHAAFSIYLSNPVSINQLPDFDNGFVSVQDEASQLLISLLDLKPGQKVLDACCAPGGKTTLMLEAQPKIDLIAVDSDLDRLQIVQDNLNRLNLSAKLHTADMTTLHSELIKHKFDRILVDAPCSATGIVRRHPDIKLNRQAGDIEKFANQQLQILKTAWELLAPGGKLVYATCSILPDENEDVISKFLSEQKDAKHQTINSDWGIITEHGKQLFPEQDSYDGFFYAVLNKS